MTADIENIKQWFVFKNHSNVFLISAKIEKLLWTVNSCDLEQAYLFFISEKKLKNEPLCDYFYIRVQ